MFIHKKNQSFALAIAFTLLFLLIASPATAETGTKARYLFEHSGISGNFEWCGVVVDNTCIVNDSGSAIIILDYASEVYYNNKNDYSSGVDFSIHGSKTVATTSQPEDGEGLKIQSERFREMLEKANAGCEHCNVKIPIIFYVNGAGYAGWFQAGFLDWPEAGYTEVDPYYTTYYSVYGEEIVDQMVDGSGPGRYSASGTMGGEAIALNSGN